MINKKVSYLKGLAEGYGLDGNNGNLEKIVVEILDCLEDIADEVDFLNSDFQRLDDYVEMLDDDLADLENFLEDDDDWDEYDWDEDDCDCGCCCDELEDEDDEE